VSLGPGPPIIWGGPIPPGPGPPLGSLVLLLAVFWLVRRFFLGLPPACEPAGTLKFPPAPLLLMAFLFIVF